MTKQPMTLADFQQLIEPSPCPSWCVDDIGHHVGERHDEDVTCHSEQLVVPLSLMPRQRYGETTWAPEYVTTYLRHRHIDGRNEVQLALGEAPGWTLTLDEASDLVQALQSVIGSAQ